MSSSGFNKKNNIIETVQMTEWEIKAIFINNGDLFSRNSIFYLKK